MIFVVPKAGYVVAWSTGPVGLVLLGGYGAFLLSVLLRRKDRRTMIRRRPRRVDASRPSAALARRRRARRCWPSVLGGAVALVPTPCLGGAVDRLDRTSATSHSTATRSSR